MAQEFDKQWRYPIERQHYVNQPIIQRNDIDLQRRMFWESAVSTGIIADYYRCGSDEADFYNDPNCLWEAPIYLPIQFDDVPKVKILKQWGWYTEDDEKPTLAYLPMYSDWTTKELLDVRENSLLRIHYFGQDLPAEFRITDKKMDSIYGVHWICKLAPERFNQFYMIQEHGTHFLKKKVRLDSEQHGSINPPPDDGSPGDARVYEHDDMPAGQALTDRRPDDYWAMVMGEDTENNVDFYNEYQNSDKIEPKKAGIYQRENLN